MNLDPLLEQIRRRDFAALLDAAHRSSHLGPTILELGTAYYRDRFSPPEVWVSGSRDALTAAYAVRAYMRSTLFGAGLYERSRAQARDLIAGVVDVRGITAGPDDVCNQAELVLAFLDAIDSWSVGSPAARLGAPEGFLSARAGGVASAAVILAFEAMFPDLVTW